MGCCLSKKPSPIPPSSGIKSPDPVKPDVNKPTKPATELPVKPEIELNPEAKPIISEKVEKEEESNATTSKDLKHRRSHERSKEEENKATTSKDVSVRSHERSSEEEASKSVVVRTSSCTKEEVDAILIQCGKLSRSNSAAKTRRYSGSKRSFDLQEEEAEGKKTPQRNRVERANGSSPRERRRRTPSRERERGGSRRVSRSPGKRSEATNPNPSGNLVISSNIKFVTVPATDPSSKRITTVKRSIGEAMSNAQPPPPPRRSEKSPYRRKPLGEINQNATKGNKLKRENETAKHQVISRSRSLRKSRDFDFLQSSEEDKTTTNYTELLLKDIKKFHGKSNNDDCEEEEDPLSLLPSCVTKACSIVEAVEDLNSSSDLNQFRFTSTVKKADLMEPSFEKYVTVRKRGCSLEEQESCGSNNLT